MKKTVAGLCLVASTFTFSSCDIAQQVLTDVVATNAVSALTDSDIAEGMKQALKQGTNKGVGVLAAKDGFFANQAVKVLFPPEAQKVESRLRSLGAGSLVDNAIEKLNRAAEDAAKKAGPIFVDAITGMSFKDAMGILMGEKDACTKYLKTNTSDKLYQAFNPVIKNSLNKVGALDAWNAVITRYNKIPLVKKVNPNLDDHVTNKTMGGVFTMIEKEESNIRKNPVSRASDLMKRVFAKQDNK
jgi:hypothetical protein